MQHERVKAGLPQRLDRGKRVGDIRHRGRTAGFKRRDGAPDAACNLVGGPLGANAELIFDPGNKTTVAGNGALEMREFEMRVRVREAGEQNRIAEVDLVHGRAAWAHPGRANSGNHTVANGHEAVADWRGGHRQDERRAIEGVGQAFSGSTAMQSISTRRLSPGRPVTWTVVRAGLWPANIRS